MKKSINFYFENSPIQSIVFHGVLGLCLLLPQILFPNHKKTIIEIELQTAPDLMEEKPVNIKSKPVEIRANSQKIAKSAVYGVSANSLTEDAASTHVKRGNTLSKEPDEKKLTSDNEGTLPTPTKDYLVTQMPVLLSEVQIPYPPLSKKKGIEGPVQLQLLIDQNGKVRQVKIISGPNEELIQAASAAVMNLQFQPARIQNDTAAVSIRYTYNFKIEK